MPLVSSKFWVGNTGKITCLRGSITQRRNLREVGLDTDYKVTSASGHVSDFEQVINLSWPTFPHSQARNVSTIFTWLVGICLSYYKFSYDTLGGEDF